MTVGRSSTSRSLGLICIATLAVLGSVQLTRADCPNRDVRCRIPDAEVRTQVSQSGCSVDGSVDVGFTGDVPAGTVTVNGQCYNSYTDTDGTTFVPMGVIPGVGTCYQYQFGDWSIWDSCRPCGSLSDLCSTSVNGCYSCLTICTSVYTAVDGDSCWDIATNNGITLDDLYSYNPGLNCDPLSINQQICVAMGQGSCTNLCEGAFV